MIDQDFKAEVENGLSPLVHSPVDAHICPECETKNNNCITFDISCKGCVSYLTFNASLGEMFAILRQWAPSVQQSIGNIISQMLDSGAHVDDRDGLTDMTMLHYAVKSGTKGIGNISDACRVVSLLLLRGANPYIRCRWTNMAAIHYAAFFDVAEVLEILLDATKDVDVDSLCFEFDQGSPLHISCKTLALDSVRMLLKHGADISLKDSNGLTPKDVLPDFDSFHDDPETQNIISEIKLLLESSYSFSNGDASQALKDESQILHELKSHDIKIGNKVYVAGLKSGILRYCGPTLFANGVWAGIELDEAVGKNDGSIDNVQYFKCPANHGIFAPLSKISKHPFTLPLTVHDNQIHETRMNLMHVTAKVNSGLKQSKQDLISPDARPAEIGDKVMLTGRKTGVVKFIGETKFAPGVWYGVELNKPVGKNDGSVDGLKYFDCPLNHGVFAPPSRVQRFDKNQASKDDKTSIRRSSRQYASQSGLDGAMRQQHAKTKMIANGSKSSSLSPNAELVLAEGTHVFYNGEIGIVQYIGPVSFAEGVWVGVELRTARGKHDGAVHGKRYFACKPGHGLLVRPSKVYVRGINGSKLISAN